MVVESFYNDELGVWEFHTEGRVDLDVVLTELAAVYKRLDPSRPFLLLWQSGAGSDPFESPDLPRLMEFVKENRPDVEGRTAIVALDDATYGMGRVAQIYGETVVPHLWVFRNRDEALAWLKGES